MKINHRNGFIIKGLKALCPLKDHGDKFKLAVRPGVMLNFISETRFIKIKSNLHGTVIKLTSNSYISKNSDG